MKDSHKEMSCGNDQTKQRILRVKISTKRALIKRIFILPNPILDPAEIFLF
jgi:hypothetical protein